MKRMEMPPGHGDEFMYPGLEKEKVTFKDVVYSILFIAAVAAIIWLL